jgi:hypothetical protein
VAGKLGDEQAAAREQERRERDPVRRRAAEPVDERSRAPRSSATRSSKPGSSTFASVTEGDYCSG